MSYFANISTFSPHHHEHHEQLHGSTWSLNRHGSLPHFGSFLGIDHYHNESEEEEIGPEDARYERDVDLVPDKNGKLRSFWFYSLFTQ